MSTTPHTGPLTRPLTADVDIPYLGFGTYLIPDDEAAAAVRTAIVAGYRHVDTAEAYGNEAAVGEGLRQAMEAEGLARGDLFVTAKLWPGNPAWGQPAKSAEDCVTSLESSLQRLGLDYVDLYLIHAPYEPEDRIAQWRGLVELAEQSKARAIGVSNFSRQHIEALAVAGLPLPAANQIELHPWSQKPQLVSYLADVGVTPIAYSSLVPLSTWRTAEGHDSAKTAQMRADGEGSRAPFASLAAKYGVTEAQVLLRWAIQLGYPVIPKSTDPARIRSNADVFGFEIDQGDMTYIAGMDRGDGVAWATGDPTQVS